MQQRKRKVRRRSTIGRSLGSAAFCAGLLSLLAPMATSHAHTPAEAASSAGAASTSAANDPPGTTYRYRGSFTAKLNHAVYVSWGDGDSEDQVVEATVEGTIPDVWG